MSNQFEKIKYNQKLVGQILERCKGVIPKIAKRVQEFYVPEIENKPPSLMQYMDYLENDIIALIRDPKNPIGNGVYDSWSQQEIAELYTVLFGKKVPGWWMEKSEKSK